jgi:hypothetical protein
MLWVLCATSLQDFHFSQSIECSIAMVDNYHPLVFIFEEKCQEAETDSPSNIEDKTSMISRINKTF